jgi:type IV pilus assembly protein PilE
MRRTRVFTLIELMIVLVVAAVIVAIAMPAFNAQMRKSRRSEILAQLQSLALAQEQYRANNTTYATAAQLGNPTATHYTITVTGVSATAYTLTATAKSGDDQNNDKGVGGTTCTPITLDQSGGKGTRANCWK